MAKYISVFEAADESDEARSKISGAVFSVLMYVLGALGAVPFRFAIGVALSVIAVFTCKKLSAPVEKFDDE